MAHPGSARTHVSSRGASILLGARELSLSSPEPAAARGSLGPLARPPKAALRARRRRLTRVPAGVLSPRLDLRRTRAPFCLATPGVRGASPLLSESEARPPRRAARTHEGPEGKNRRGRLQKLSRGRALAGGMTDGRAATGRRAAPPSYCVAGSRRRRGRLRHLHPRRRRLDFPYGGAIAL